MVPWMTVFWREMSFVCLSVAWLVFPWFLQKTCCTIYRLTDFTFFSTFSGALDWRFWQVCWFAGESDWINHVCWRCWKGQRSSNEAKNQIHSEGKGGIEHVFHQKIWDRLFWFQPHKVKRSWEINIYRMIGFFLRLLTNFCMLIPTTIGDIFNIIKAGIIWTGIDQWANVEYAHLCNYNAISWFQCGLSVLLHGLWPILSHDL